MAEIIGARADAGRIEDHVRETMRAALARGEDIAARAQDRLAPAIAAIDSATELQKTADETEATAWAQVEAQGAKSDAAIGGIRDAMWNALGARARARTWTKSSRKASRSTRRAIRATNP